MIFYLYINYLTWINFHVDVDLEKFRVDYFSQMARPKEFCVDLFSPGFIFARKGILRNIFVLRKANRLCFRSTAFTSLQKIQMCK